MNYVTKKKLYLTIAENEHLLRDLKSDALSAQYETDRKYKERGHRESEYHRVNHGVHRGRDQRGGNMATSTQFVSGDHRRSKSSGSATQEVDSRQPDRRSANQQNNSSRPVYNMNQQKQELHRVRHFQEVKRVKGEIGMMVSQGPKTKEIRREGGCSFHFLGEEGRLQKVETGLVGY